MRSDADSTAPELLRPGVLILAGGVGSRCGNRDKGWLEFEGEALVVRRIRECSNANWDLAISANRSLELYRSLGFPVIEDPTPEFAGPLAAVSAALSASFGSPLITVPVDAVRLSGDVLLKLLEASNGGERLVFAWDADGAQPLVAVWPASARAAVDEALHGGNHSVRALQRQLSAVAVEFPQNRFGNLNSLAEIKAAEAAVEAGSC